MVIYDCDDFEVIRRQGDPGFLLITFSSLGMFNAAGSFADGKVFWGQSLAEKFNYAAIGFVAKQRNWFCSPYMHAACDKVAAVASGFDRVLAYGSSMGGYAALRWGKRAGAATAIAFAPQLSIDPAAVGTFDRRYEYAFRPDRHRGMDISAEHVGIPSFLFFDPSAAEDHQHAKLIRERVPNITKLHMLSCGHECIRAFANSGVADRMLRLCGAGDIDAVKKLASSLRKVSAIRPVELAMRIARNKKTTAERIFIKYQNCFEIRQKAAFVELLKSAHATSTGTNMTLDPESSHQLRSFISATAASVGGASSAGDKMPGERATSKPASRLIHLHVPKTAGTALRSAFEKQFVGKLRIFPEWDESKYAGINPDDFDFYSGHIGFDTASRIGGDIVTVLRHPVDRFISVYYFWRQLFATGVEKSANTQLASSYSLEDFARIRDQPGLIEEFQNRCTYQVAYGSSLSQRRHLRLQGLTDDQIFNTAVDNLAKFRAIGIQENMGRFSDIISDRFGVNLDIKKINVTRERPEIQAISVHTRRIIQDWVFMDLELYQEALRMT